MFQRPISKTIDFEMLARHFPNVESIDVSNIGLTDLKGIDKFSKLEYLNLANNNITFWSNQTSKNTNLKELNLSKNKISVIENSNNVENLEILDLSHNLLDNKTIFKFNLFPKLHTLMLNNNNIGPTFDFRVFQSKSKLENLFLHDNKIETITRLTNNFSVKKLYLQHNKIKNIENFRKYLGATEVLDLSNNLGLELTDISFILMYNLTSLFLNKIIETNILKPSIFKNLKTLKTLSINKNQLKQINVNDFEGLESLENFHFAQNEISAFDYTELKIKLPSLQAINVTGNLWNQSYLIEMRKFLKIQSIKVIDENHPEIPDEFMSFQTIIIAGLTGVILVLIILLFLSFNKTKILDDTENKATLRRFQNGVNLRRDYNLDSPDHRDSMEMNADNDFIYTEFLTYNDTF
jgi:Leucine-rich repeat (LRR) protein